MFSSHHDNPITSEAERVIIFKSQPTKYAIYNDEFKKIKLVTKKNLKDNKLFKIGQVACWMGGSLQSQMIGKEQKDNLVVKLKVNKVEIK